MRGRGQILPARRTARVAAFGLDPHQVAEGMAQRRERRGRRGERAEHGLGLVADRALQAAEARAVLVEGEAAVVAEVAPQPVEREREQRQRVGAAGVVRERLDQAVLELEPGDARRAGDDLGEVAGVHRRQRLLAEGQRAPRRQALQRADVIRAQRRQAVELARLGRQRRTQGLHEARRGLGRAGGDELLELVDDEQHRRPPRLGGEGRCERRAERRRRGCRRGLARRQQARELLVGLAQRSHRGEHAPVGHARDARQHAGAHQRGLAAARGADHHQQAFAAIAAHLRQGVEAAALFLLAAEIHRRISRLERR